MGEFIREAVVGTLNPDGSAHLTPLGYREHGERVLLAPFHPSRTLQNLRTHRSAVLNFTDDVRVVAGCLTGRREWPLVASDVVAVPRLAGALAHREIEVAIVHEDAIRPRFECRVVASGNHRPFTGFNRAQAAVIEAAVMVSRLDWLSAEEVVSSLRGLRVAVEKTAGERERCAWDWLCEAVAGHPRHRDAARDLVS